MPIYEYKCIECGVRLERLIRNEQDIPVECPECGAASALRKQFSTFSPSVAKPAAPGCEGGACEMASTCPSGSCCPVV